MYGSTLVRGSTAHSLNSEPIKTNYMPSSRWNVLSAPVYLLNFLLGDGALDVFILIIHLVLSATSLEKPFWRLTCQFGATEHGVVTFPGC